MTNLTKIKEDLSKLKVIINSLDDITDLCAFKIGGGTAEDTKLQPRYLTKTDEIGTHQDGVVYSLGTLSKHEIKVVNLQTDVPISLDPSEKNINPKDSSNPYHFDKKTRMPGFYHHLDNSYLYMAIDPTRTNAYLLRDLQKDLTYLSGLNTIVIEAITSTVAASMGSVYDETMIAKLKELHSHKPITIVVLGDKKSSENLSAYEKNFEEDITFEKPSSHLLKFKPKTQSVNSDKVDLTQVSLYYLNAPDKKMFLSTHSVNTLYTIFKETIESNNPLLIQCSNALSRTAKLAFAYEILRDFASISSDTHITHIADRLKFKHERLCRSCSPEMLSEREELKQAIALGLTLKACSAIEACFRLLSANTSNAETLFRIITDLEVKTTLAQKIAYLNSVSTNNSELGTHTRFKFFPAIQKLLGDPEALTLIKTLKEAYELREAIETKLFQCTGSKLGASNTTSNSNTSWELLEEEILRKSTETVTLVGAQATTRSGKDEEDEEDDDEADGKLKTRNGT